MSTTPERVKPGQTIKAKTVNDTIVKGTQQAVKVGDGLSKRQAGRSIAIYSEDQRSLPIVAVQFKKAKIQEIYEDYYTCVIVSYQDGDWAETEQVIPVAKPMRFRTAFYDGQTIQYGNGDNITYAKDATNPEWKRQADDGVAEVDQIVIETPYVGEIILIYQTDTGLEVDDQALAWEELGQRVWVVQE